MAKLFLWEFSMCSMLAGYEFPQQLQIQCQSVTLLHYATLPVSPYVYIVYLFGLFAYYGTKYVLTYTCFT